MKKKMLITGTTQGIGKEIYNHYKESYDVITINRRGFEGNNIICDLSKIDEVINVTKVIKDMEIDILINNAGGAEPIVFEQMTAEDFIQCTNLNYHSPILLSQAVIENMIKKNDGKIINISSIASKSPRPMIPHYGASKSALEKFSSSIAVAYAGSGVTINCICPGGVDTKTSKENRKKMALLSGLDEQFYNDEMKNKNGLGRMITPYEVVKAIDYLISDEAGVISGQTINVCGVREVH